METTDKNESVLKELATDIFNFFKEKDLIYDEDAMQVITVDELTRDLKGGFTKVLLDDLEEHGYKDIAGLEANVIAIQIDKFTQEIDIKEYENEVANTRTHIKEIANNIKTGNVEAITDYLNEHKQDNVDSYNIMRKLTAYDTRFYPGQIACKIDDCFLSVQESDDCYDYTIYDKDYNLLDGGTYDNTEINIYQAIHEIAEFDSGFSIWEREGVELIDYDELIDKAESNELTKLLQSVENNQKNLVQSLLANDHARSEMTRALSICDLMENLPEDVTIEDAEMIYNYCHDIWLKTDGLTFEEIEDFAITTINERVYPINEMVLLPRNYFAAAVFDKSFDHITMDEDTEKLMEYNYKMLGVKMKFQSQVTGFQEEQELDLERE